MSAQAYTKQCLHFTDTSKAVKLYEICAFTFQKYSAKCCAREFVYCMCALLYICVHVHCEIPIFVFYYMNRSLGMEYKLQF